MMTKKDFDHIIANLRKADLVTQAAPWIHEEFWHTDCQVRYVGIKLTEDWAEVIPEGNNLLLKCIFNKNISLIEFYLANKPPFIKISQTNLTSATKWEHLFGELKHQLKQDKQDYIKHSAKVDNLYQKIHAHLK